MKIVDSPLFTFCQISKESLEHLFSTLSNIKYFLAFCTVVMVGKLISCHLRFDICEHNVWLFGKEMQSINHIVLQGKQAIFQCRHLKKAIPPFHV